MDDADSDEESHISFAKSKSNCIDSDITGITCGHFDGGLCLFVFSAAETEEPMGR